MVAINSREFTSLYGYFHRTHTHRMSLKAKCKHNGSTHPRFFETYSLSSLSFSRTHMHICPPPQVRAARDKSGDELASVQKQLFPLRRENARLVRANNSIHLQAMKVCTNEWATLLFVCVPLMPLLCTRLNVYFLLGLFDSMYL
jgi:hypothetical protein